jgi:hypothetical protein
MRNVLLILFVCGLWSIADARGARVGVGSAVGYMLQPTATIAGTKVTPWAGSDSMWYVTNWDGERVMAKGIYVHDTATAGYVSVHLVDSDSGATSTTDVSKWKWFTFRGNAGDWRGIVFDAVKKRAASDSLSRKQFDILQ